MQPRGIFCVHALSLWLASVGGLAESEPLQRPPHCKPQGSLLLDKPYPLPRAASLGGLPFCTNFQTCSCCNVSHVMTIQRNLGTLAEHHEDLPGLSLPCHQALESVMCGVCDPEVGTGAVVEYCPELCDLWWDACQNDFAAIDATSGHLRWCGPATQQTATICSRVRDLVPTGTDLCKASGHSVAQRELPSLCFSGSPRSSSSELCDASEAYIAATTPVDHPLHDAAVPVSVGAAVLLGVLGILMSAYMSRVKAEEAAQSVGGSSMTETEVRERQQMNHTDEAMAAAQWATDMRRRAIAAGGEDLWGETNNGSA